MPDKSPRNPMEGTLGSEMILQQPRYPQLGTQAPPLNIKTQQSNLYHSWLVCCELRDSDQWWPTTRCWLGPRSWPRTLLCLVDVVVDTGEHTVGFLWWSSCCNRLVLLAEGLALLCGFWDACPDCCYLMTESHLTLKDGWIFFWGGRGEGILFWPSSPPKVP